MDSDLGRTWPELKVALAFWRPVIKYDNFHLDKDTFLFHVFKYIYIFKEIFC